MTTEKQKPAHLVLSEMEVMASALHHMIREPHAYEWTEAIGKRWAQAYENMRRDLVESERMCGGVEMQSALLAALDGIRGMNEGYTPVRTGRGYASEPPSSLDHGGGLHHALSVTGYVEGDAEVFREGWDAAMRYAGRKRAQPPKDAKEPDTETVERIARIIHAAMRWQREGDTPSWVAGGNSLAQDFARNMARLLIKHVRDPQEKGDTIW